MENIEERLKRLEQIVAPEDQDADISEALTGLYSNQIHMLITLCDFLFDSAAQSEALAHHLSQMIPEEIKQEISDITDDQQDGTGPKLSVIDGGTDITGG